ncbi:hypothetical protein KQH62_01105 [bacterium]|nr:hypothetical protein [bacterium]
MRSKRKRSGLIVIVVFVGVVALSIVGLIIAQNQRQARIESPGPVASQDDVPRLTADEAYQAQAEGAVLVDTRSAAQYQQQRVAGAINIPLDQLETRMAELDPDTWYVTYCT